MTQISHWNPYREMEELMDQFSRQRGGTLQRGNGHEGLGVADWIPAVDIREDEKEFLLHMDLPQVDQKDVKLTVEDGVLTISGERKAVSEASDANTKWHRVERYHGSFARSFTLPDNVREDSVDAHFAAGVLTVHLPKSAPEPAKLREIQIRPA